MSQDPQPLYEGMFLMGQAAGADVNSAAAHIREILDKADASVLTLHKWDDRKLAYPIRGQKRGLFIIALFRVPGSKITRIERDCNLSEQILRVLITRGEHMGQTEIDTLVEADSVSELKDKLQEDGPAAPSPTPVAVVTETTAPQRDVAPSTDPIASP